jgi:hypothetical protein
MSGRRYNARKTMTTTKLTDAQKNALASAMTNDAGEIQLARTVRGNARAKIISALVGAKLALYRKGTLAITNEGRVAIGAGPVDQPRGAKAKSKAKAKAKAKSPRAETKQATLIQMLKRPNGATNPEIAAKLDWQPHTVRGVIAGTLKKKLGLVVATEKQERGLVYRIC